ncbi:MAG: hypothetical protein JWO54_659 [Candidatus Saccharibacteria bacterium]|nr:hypothetical protein [Candidatus Saccharibacteria bacterium]MDB5180897.1 hypothetical protein [Candidatus Saccharibacteria bacterium]
MEFLKLVRKRSFLSEAIYTVLNIALAIAVVVVIRYTGSVGFAIGLVVLSKWRVFAVRPRFWWANLRSNLVDFIVSISFVLHMYIVNDAVIAEPRKLMLLGILTVLYIGWLLYIKPRSKRAYIAVQAGVAVMLGTSALFAISYNWPASVVVLVMWLIGYTAARHILSAYDDETHGLFLSLAWGVVLAQVAWVAYHWTIAYNLPFSSNLHLPQVAIIVTLMSFLAFKSYDSFHKNAKIRMTDIILPLLFTLSVIAVLLIIFNRVGTAI